MARTQLGLVWAAAEAPPDLSVPQAANVQASSGDGGINLDHVNGTIALRSGDGRIQASQQFRQRVGRHRRRAIDLDGVDGAWRR